MRMNMSTSISNFASIVMAATPLLAVLTWMTTVAH